MNNETKQKLIQEIYNKANLWEAQASCESVKAIRSGKKEDKDYAREILARHDACQYLAKEVVFLIHKYIQDES